MDSINRILIPVEDHINPDVVSEFKIIMRLSNDGDYDHNFNIIYCKSAQYERDTVFTNKTDIGNLYACNNKEHIE